MEIKEYLKSDNLMYLPLKSTSLKEIVKEIRNLEDGKAPGMVSLIYAILL